MGEENRAEPGFYDYEGPESNMLQTEHLRSHLTDGQWHDSCSYCLHRRRYGGNGVTSLSDGSASDDKTTLGPDS